MRKNPTGWIIASRLCRRDRPRWRPHNYGCRTRPFTNYILVVQPVAQTTLLATVALLLCEFRKKYAQTANRNCRHAFAAEYWKPDHRIDAARIDVHATTTYSSPRRVDEQFRCKVLLYPARASIKRTNKQPHTRIKETQSTSRRTVWRTIAFDVSRAGVTENRRHEYEKNTHTTNIYANRKDTHTHIATRVSGNGVRRRRPGRPVFAMSREAPTTIRARLKCSRTVRAIVHTHASFVCVSVCVWRGARL